MAPSAILDKILSKIQHIYQGGHSGLRLRLPPFCVKPGGGRRGGVEAFDTGCGYFKVLPRSGIALNTGHTDSNIFQVFFPFHPPITTNCEVSTYIIQVISQSNFAGDKFMGQIIVFLLQSHVRFLKPFVFSLQETLQDELTN